MRIVKGVINNCAQSTLSPNSNNAELIDFIGTTIDTIKGILSKQGVYWIFHLNSSKVWWYMLKS